MRYEKLFTPGRIGPLTLKNRGVMMPMATDLADKDGIYRRHNDYAGIAETTRRPQN